jgi:hypothetical protein
MSVAVLVEVEQLRRKRFAAGVSLTLVLVDAYFQFSGHGESFPWSDATSLARPAFPISCSCDAGMHIGSARKL